MSEDEEAAEARRTKAVEVAQAKVAGGILLNEDDIEIDADAKVSEGGDPGTWVGAWLWITNEELGLDEDGEPLEV